MFKKKTKKPMTLAEKLFCYLSAFTVFILVILWLFQSVLMEPIYRSIKLSDMEKCAESVARSIDDLKNGVAEASERFNACISVYEIKSSSGNRVASSHIKTSCMVHNISSDTFLNTMYEGAKGEKYFFKREEISLPEGDFPIMSGGTENPNPSSVICSTIVKTSYSEYLILVDSEIIPLMSTTRTLRMQLIIISAILFVTALILSYIISDRIANPFKKMTKEAAKLAHGNYEVNFATDSFEEARHLGETLDYAAQELSKLDTMQKELISNISHDLRTPLTLISGYSEVMRDIPGEMTPDNMQVIIDETERLSSLVSDLLELSRLTTGKQQINPEKFNITETVKETLKRYEKLTEHDGYTITFNSEGDIWVTADKIRILQVIYNLINNAVNYTGEDKKVTVTQSENGKNVRISVTDTGLGIPKEQLPMIWERYYKVSDFHSRGKVGTGLGLSIVKNILTLHKAPFGVISTENIGSTFWFELPMN